MRHIHWTTMFGVLIGISGFVCAQQRLPAANPVGTLSVGRSAYIAGQPVRFRFVVNNNTGSTVHFDFVMAQQFDVSVTDPNGNQIWDWAHNRMFAQKITALALRPGAFRVYYATWYPNRDLPGGNYTASATLTASIHPAFREGYAMPPDTDPNDTAPPLVPKQGLGDVVAGTPQVSATATFTITPW